MLKNCAHHEFILKFYCEPCQVLVCDDCINYGPHQTKNHKVMGINDAYEMRNNQIKEKIEVGVAQKKEQLLNQLQVLDQRLHEIHEVKIEIEKDIHMEFEKGILRRLKDSQGSLIAMLQRDITWLQSYINDIDDFLHTFEYLALTEINVLPLLFMSKTLKNQSIKLISIIIKTDIKEQPSDLPRELLTLRKRLQDNVIINSQIDLKNQLIIKCRQEKQNSLKQIKQEFYDKMSDEIYDWVRLLKKIVTTFDSLCLICTFCGCFVDVINEDCALNNKPYEDVQLDFIGYTEEIPKMKQFGNSQHFYGNPRAEYLKLKRDKYPDFGNYSEQKKAAKEIYLKTFRNLWFSIIDLKARRFLQQLDFHALFQKYDPDNSGFLSIIKFKYLLNKELKMNAEEIDKLVIYFKHEKEDKIYYSDFLNVDVYLEELQRLEKQLAQDQISLPKLYNRRSKTVSNAPPPPNYHSRPRSQQEVPQSIQLTQPTQPIYSNFTRFSQVVERLDIAQPSNYSKTNTQQQQQYQQTQEYQGVLKSTKRSSSLQSKKVQFEDSTVSRFIETQQGGNHFSKYY